LDLAGAQQEYSALQTLGQSGPFAGGDPFKSSQREQDFVAIGQALQSGDLAGAQPVFAQLQSTFHSRQSSEPSPAVVVNLGGSSSPSSAATSSTNSPPATAANSTASASGSEIVLNLGNMTPGEQITIGLSNPGNSSEQVTIGVSGQRPSRSRSISIRTAIRRSSSTCSTALPATRRRTAVSA
jgi:hypothetical protein